MTMHMDEQEIEGNVQRCPYFRPQSEIIPNYTPQNVEGYAENCKWELFLHNIDDEDKQKATVAAAVAGGQVWLDHLEALADGTPNIISIIKLGLGPFSEEFQRHITATKANGKCAFEAAIAACDAWNKFVHFLADANVPNAFDALTASEANVTANKWAEWKAKQWIDKWRQWLDPGWMDRLAEDALKNPQLHLGVVSTGRAAYRRYKQKPPSREAPTSTPPSTEAPTSTPQAQTPKPTHSNNTYTPRPTQVLNAGATVGLPDGTLARHIDGPTTLNGDDRNAKRRR